MGSDAARQEEEAIAFYEAWWYLREHPKHPLSDPMALWDWASRIELDVVKVNPETEEIDDDESKNTAIRYWIEGGGMEWESTGDVTGWKGWIGIHDPDLNCGAPTFEAAVIEFCRLVKLHYNEDGSTKETITKETI